MSSSNLPAFSRSAAFYDRIYDFRDREKDVAMVAELAGNPKEIPDWCRRVVDWGCGTGEHLRLWPKHGWPAMGIDLSEQMVQRATEKGLHVLHGSLHRGLLGKHEDCRFVSHIQTSFFGAFSYAAIIGHDPALSVVSRWAMRGGLFAFDVLHYAAAACHLRTNETREIGPENEDPSLCRQATKKFDLNRSLLTYQLEFTPGDGKPFTETHVMRAFTPREITDALDRHGFDVLRLFDPESPNEGPVRPDSFYFMVVARKR